MRFSNSSSSAGTDLSGVFAQDRMRICGAEDPGGKAAKQLVRAGAQNRESISIRQPGITAVQLRVGS